MSNDPFARIEFDHNAASQMRADLKKVEESAKVMGSQLTLLAESLETVWRHKDAKKVGELMRTYASRYHELAHDSQLVRDRLDSTEEAIRLENGRRYEARARSLGIPTDYPDPETVRENERKRREELIRDSVLGPSNPPWQASVH